MNSASQLVNFFKQYPLLSFRPGTPIVSGGDNSQIFYIKSGLVKQSDKLLISFHRPSSFFPLSSISAVASNLYCYTAYSSVKVYCAPAVDFRHFIKAHPQIVMSISFRMLDIIDHLNHRMQLLSYGRSDIRLVMFLIFIAQYLGTTTGHQTVINLQISHQEIAAWIGTTRETVSWHMLDLKRRGLINYSRRQIIIPDLPRLQQTINFA